MKKIIFVAISFMVCGIFITISGKVDLTKKAFAAEDRCITSLKRNIRRASSDTYMNGAFRRFKSCIENYAWKEKPKCMTVCAEGKMTSVCSQARPNTKSKCLAEAKQFVCETTCTKP